MRAIADLLGHRAPNADEREVMAHVVEVARAWQEQECDLGTVRQLTTGYERWQAMRFSDLGSEVKRTLMALVEALVAEDRSGWQSDHGWVGKEAEVIALMAKATTNHEGKRVWAWAMHSVNGEAIYPLSHLAPGEERREREQAADLVYRDYRRRKRGG